jgi:predicted transposase/invertase (TIGR01784 family)
MDQKYDEGLEKGVETGTKEIVKTMLKENMDTELIAKLTRLSIDEINQLKSQT